MLVSRMRDFVRDENGATAIEYALIAGMLSIAIVGSLMLLKPTLAGLYESVVTGLTST